MIENKHVCLNCG